MPVGQISNPLGAFGLPGPGAGAAMEGPLTIEAQNRSTTLDPLSGGATDGLFRTIRAGMVVSPVYGSSGFYGAAPMAVTPTTGFNQITLGIAAEDITSFGGTTNSTGQEKPTTKNQQVGSVIVYGVAYAMFCSTDHPGAGDKQLPAYVQWASTTLSILQASCSFGLCALSTEVISTAVVPTSTHNLMNLVGIAYTSKGGLNATVGASTGPQLYPIIVGKPG